MKIAPLHHSLSRYKSESSSWYFVPRKNWHWTDDSDWTCLTTASENISQSSTMAFVFVDDVRIDTTLDSQGGNLLLAPLNNTMLWSYCSHLPTGKSYSLFNVIFSLKWKCNFASMVTLFWAQYLLCSIYVSNLFNLK